MPFIFNYFGSIAHTFKKKTLSYNQSREALEHILTNVIELRIESTIWKTLIQNDFDCIEDLVNIADIDI